MNISRSLALLLPLFAAPVFAGNVTFLNSPGIAIDTVNWSSLGADQTLFSNGATVISNIGNTVTIGLGTQPGLGGLASVVCPAVNPSNCSWGHQTSGYTDGETLLWAEGLDTNSNPVGTGPVTLSFANGVSGVGTYLQSDWLGAFNVTLSLFNGQTLLSSSSFSSDSNGDPLFVGAQDDTYGEITSAALAVTQCGTEGCDANDFSVGTVEIYGTPEPSTFLLGGLALTLIGGVRRKRGSGK